MRQHRHHRAEFSPLLLLRPRSAAGLRPNHVTAHLLASRLPRHRVAQMFDALAQRLRALIRATDLFMRDDDACCWLLLPQTAPAGLAILLERIVALGAAATPEDGLRIEIATASFTSADAGAGSTNARLLMGTLRSRVG